MWGFGFQSPVILWCGPSELSINGNPVGVGASQEDLNYDSFNCFKLCNVAVKSLHCGFIFQKEKRKLMGEKKPMGR